jgi:hypothetical protein
MGQYMPRLAAIRLSSVENRSRPQLRIALRAHRLAAASGPQAGVALSVMETIGAPVTLAAGLVSLRLRSYARTANWYYGSSACHGHCTQYREMCKPTNRSFVLKQSILIDGVREPAAERPKTWPFQGREYRMECCQYHVLDKAAHMACLLLVLGSNRQQQRSASAHRPSAFSCHIRCLLRSATTRMVVPVYFTVDTVQSLQAAGISTYLHRLKRYVVRVRLQY